MTGLSITGLSDAMRRVDATEAREAGLKAVAGVLDEPHVAEYLRRVREGIEPYAEAQKAQCATSEMLRGRIHAAGVSFVEGDPKPLRAVTAEIEAMSADIVARAASADQQEGKMKAIPENIRGTIHPLEMVPTLAASLARLRDLVDHAYRLRNTIETAAAVIAPQPGAGPQDDNSTAQVQADALTQGFDRALDILEDALNGGHHAASAVMRGLGHGD